MGEMKRRKCKHPAKYILFNGRYAYCAKCNKVLSEDPEYPKSEKPKGKERL